MMLVSIIIPTHNRKEFLIKALDSVLNQTYRNIEVIIIDDASTDGTGDLILSYNDERIKYFKNSSNLYAAESRNIGIQNSNGNFIAFLDDDDIWLPEKLEQQILLFSDPKVGLVYSGISLLFTEYNISYNTKPNKKGMIYKDLLVKNYIGGTVSVVIRREAINNICNHKYFDSNFKAREEYDLWIRISKEWKIDYISQPLVVAYYRNHLERISTNLNNYTSAIQLLNKKYNSEINSLLSNKEKIERLFFQNFFLGSQAIKINNIKLARKYYLKAFKLKKNIKSFIIYLACFFGAKFIIKLRYYFK